jgi:hypothetical protein
MAEIKLVFPQEASTTPSVYTRMAEVEKKIAAYATASSPKANKLRERPKFPAFPNMTVSKRATIILRFNLSTKAIIPVITPMIKTLEALKKTIWVISSPFKRPDVSKVNIRQGLKM